MGLCSSSPSGASADEKRKSNNNNNTNNPSSSTSKMAGGGSQLNLHNTGNVTNEYRTASPLKRMHTRSSQLKLGVAVPQSLLQHEQNSSESKTGMKKETRTDIMSAMQKETSGLSQFSFHQLTAICDAMTLISVPANEPVCQHVEGIYYVVTGTLQREKMSELISTKALFGVDSLFSSTNTENNTKIISKGCRGVESGGADGGGDKVGPATICHIHRQLFQAVLINQTKKSDSKRSKIVSSIPMLAPLSRSQQARVSNVMKKVKFKEGETIIKQGEVGNTMFFIERGEVVIYQQNRGEAEPEEVNRHGAGGFFGKYYFFFSFPSLQKNTHFFFN